MKILMPVDGSEYTRHMLDYAAAQGCWPGSAPHGTHGSRPSFTGSGSPAG